MIWHRGKISGAVTPGDWNNDPHEVDVEALREALKIGSGGSGGSGDGVWILIDDVEFLSPVSSFNIEGLQYFSVLKIEYYMFTRYSSGDGHFRMYFNGDTRASNYTSFMHFTDSSGGHQRLSSWPNNYPLFVRAESANVNALNMGEILVSIEEGVKRLAVNRIAMIGGNYFFEATHLSKWNNLQDTVWSLDISSPNGTAWGFYTVYGRSLND